MQQPEQLANDQIWWMPVTAAFLPFLVWPVEMLLPYPVVIEELAKGILVWNLLSSEVTQKSWQLALSVGLLFGASETVLYTVNAILAGNLGVLVWRVLLTMPMHVLTVMIMFWLGQRGRYGFGVGVILAMLVHWGFNEVVSGI